MDNSFIIDNLLEQQKGERLEFKTKPEIDAIGKVITSFVNGQGGDLIIGINDKKEIIGISEADFHCENIRIALVERIKPTAPITVQTVPYKGVDVILISVWEGGRKPYQYNGIIYDRSGKISKIANSDRLSNLISERKKADYHWERMSLLGAEFSDLDFNEINNTISLYKDYKKDAIIENEEDFLIQVGLIQNGNITNACIVLFGKNPTRFIPQSRIRVTLYPSNKSGDVFTDDRIYEGNIFRNIENIFNSLDVIYGKTTIVDGLVRTDKLNYPEMAIREGIMNAIVHRDYNSIKGFLQISIYSDRTEISNYGGLPDGITIPELRKEHHSILRNPDIATMCFIHKRIEMLGSGTLRMIRDCKTNKFKIPKWSEKDNIVTVTFAEVTHNRKSDQDTEPVITGISDHVIAKAKEVIDASFKRVVEGVTEGVVEGVTEGVIKGVTGGVTEILTGGAINAISGGLIDSLKNTVTNSVREKLNIISLLLYKKEGLRSVEIEKETGIPVKSAERYLKMLKDAGIIEFRGASRTGGYYLAKDTRTFLNEK